MLSNTVRETLKGLAIYAVPKSVLRRRTGDAATARYCYSVFLRHLVLIGQHGGGTAPRRVAELGPGDSIGVGLAALLAGAERYDGFDVRHYDVTERTRTIFEELVALFQARAPIPDATEWPEVRPTLQSYAFPASILDEARLAPTLAPERIARIRRDLDAEPEARSMIGYAAPWAGAAEIERDSIDWIVSQAVMEHVDAPAETYARASPGSSLAAP